MPPPADPRYIGIDIDALYDRVLVFSAWKLRRCRYVPLCEEELAQRAFLSLHLKWNPSQCSAIQFLRLRVLNEIDQYLRGGEANNRLHVSDEKFNHFVENTPADGSEFEVVFHDQEVVYLLRYIKEVHFGAHALAQWILIENIEDLTEISILMNLKRHQVEHYKKRLRSILREFYDQTGNKNSPEARLLKLVDRSK